ncbi:hypothetical protein N7456_010857 [Penicillium angulare]|uniref:Uncharacterized protein n=1 Tax=Penicillium angulare TaxID=116970 RepID=A0A9W9JZM8_9EURO|nr:hypothetical protein N7456_010857 [Penicillium angulare]
MSDDDERRHESGSEEEETDRENEIILSDEEESSDEEKELEDDAPVHKQLQHIVKSIKAGEVDWTAPREYLGRHGKLSTHLTGQSEKTSECILHFLLRDDDMSLKVERERMAKAIRCIGRYHPQLLTISSSERPTPTPLYLALDNLDSDRIYLIKHGMLKRNSLLNINIKREDLAKAIEKTCGIRLENCLHRAMRSPLQNIDRSLLKRLVECASIDAINAQDKDDWTPLHCAAQYELASEKMLGTIQALIRRGEADREGTSIDAGGTKYALDILCKRRKDKLSVYEVHMKTREEDQELEAKRVPKNIRSGPTPQKPTDSLKGKEENLEPVDRQNRENKELPKAENGPRNRTLLHASRADESSNKTAIEAKEDPKMGIAHSNTANTNAKRATASDKPSESERRKQEIREEKREERRREREKWSLAIRNELKLHCLRTRPIAQAKRFLHGSKNDGELNSSAEFKEFS